MLYTCLLDLENECKHKLFVHSESYKLPFNLGPMKSILFFCVFLFFDVIQIYQNKFCLLKIINKTLTI